MAGETIEAPDISGPVPGGDTLSSALGTSQPAPPAPDVSGGSPLSSIPSRASSDLAPSPQPAAPPADLPRFQRTFKNTLQGLLLGFAQGNILGAVQGALDPQVPQRVLQQQRQVVSAQVADTLNKARINEINLQSLPQHLRDEHDTAVLDHVKFMTTMYGPPDETFDNSSEAAHEALTKHVANGNVPLGHVISDSNTTYAWHADRASKASNAYQDVHDAGVLDGNPALSGITQPQWAATDEKEKSGMWAKAQQSLAPVAPSIDAKSRAGQIQAASRQLQTVQGLPATDPSKARLLKVAQTNVDILNKADADPKFADKVDESQRQDFMKQIQGIADVPANLKKGYAIQIQQSPTQSQFLKDKELVLGHMNQYQSQVDAARQKREDSESPDWVPKATADQKKRADLADNIAENAASINGILARRPDLVGKISGRVTKAETLVGNNDPDLNAIGVDTHNLAMANSSVHGFRSNEGVADTETKILNGFKNGPDGVRGALKATTDSVQTFVDAARPATSPKHSSNGGVSAFYEKQKKQGGGGSFFGAGTTPTH